MAELHSETASPEEHGRYRLFRERPGIGVALLFTGLAFPLLVSILLLIFGDGFFTSSLINKLIFIFLIALSIGASLWATSAIRSRLIARYAEEECDATR
ncbi:MAG: hypothetical protein U5O39_01415 [Gammaproteobacteria bacterium]|nr:hypothetical protein [Gammaproteobacteria bacterium]